MRCVGDEVPLCLAGGLQAGEQLIEGVAEGLELVVRAGQAQPLVQAAGRDPAAAAVMVASGRRIRPAASQPSATAIAVTIASAMGASISTCRKSLLATSLPSRNASI
jgi:hypothetical protein